MRPGFLHTCLLSLYFLITSAASPRDKYREGPDVINNVGPDLSKEPTCEELRAMWRFSKRQSRAAESTNELPTYRDPFAYNVWPDQASLRSVGGGKMRRPLVYGRLVHNVVARPRIIDTTPDRIRAFEEVARLFGTNMAERVAHNRMRPAAIRLVGGREGNGVYGKGGSFQHLKEIIQSERSRELHEQKVAEENATRESALRYQRMMFEQRERERQREKEREMERERENERDRDRNRNGEREEVNYKGRSRSQMGDGVVNFPDVLAPSKFDNDVYANYNFMQRNYPESMCFRNEKLRRMMMDECERMPLCCKNGVWNPQPQRAPGQYRTPAMDQEDSVNNAIPMPMINYKYPAAVNVSSKLQPQYSDPDGSVQGPPPPIVVPTY